jgi:hypothetical protein
MISRGPLGARQAGCGAGTPETLGPGRLTHAR